MDINIREVFGPNFVAFFGERYSPLP